MDEPAAHPQPVAPTAAAPATPVAPTSRLQRLRGPLVTAAVVGGLTVALHVRDPHTSGSWGLCPWFALTGHYCPGCGALRAVNDLGNGDVLGAASSNLLFVAMVPLLVYWWARWARRAWSGAPRPASAGDRSGTWIAVATVVMIVFAVVRNLPAGSWLAP